MWETGDTVEEEEAKDDLLVRSYNTHISSGRPAVNSPATHGPVWWKGLWEGLLAPSTAAFAISHRTLLNLHCVYMYDHSKVYTVFHPTVGSGKWTLEGEGSVIIRVMLEMLSES